MMLELPLTLFVTGKGITWQLGQAPADPQLTREAMSSSVMLPGKLREAWVWHLVQQGGADRLCTGICLIKMWVSCIKISAHSSLPSQFTYSEQLNGEPRQHTMQLGGFALYG